MEIRVERGDIAQYAADAIVVNLFEGVTRPGGGTGAVDKALDGAISRVIADGGCRGKEGELTLIHTLGKIPSPRVLVTGLGKQEKFSLDTVRTISASAGRYLRRARCQTIASITHGAGIAGLDPEACAQAIAEGTLLGLYTFRRHKKPDEDHVDVRELVLIEFDEARDHDTGRGNLAECVDQRQIAVLAPAVAVGDDARDGAVQRLVDGAGAAAGPGDALEEVDHDGVGLVLRDVAPFDADLHGAPFDLMPVAAGL